MEIQKFEELLRQNESDKLDFKEVFDLSREHQKKEFVKDVSAIANSKGGRGYIVFGIRDKTKEVRGITLMDFDEERVQQIVSARVYPPVSIRFEAFEYQEKTVAVVTIFKSEQRPHQILQTGSFHLRRGSTTDVARRHEVANMMQESGHVCVETSILNRASLNDLDFSSMADYIAPGVLSHNDGKLLILAEALGFIGKDVERAQLRPTLGGMLLFGKDPQRFIHCSGIRFEYDGKSELLSGNIPTLLDAAEKKIEEIFQGTSYPINALFEALYNAVVHRDYWDHSREILVSVREMAIEVLNPGALWNRKRIYRLDSSLIPRKRNPWLYQRLLMVDKKHRFLNNDYGLSNIRKCFADDADIKFINIISRNIFKISLPGLAGFRNPEAPVQAEDS